MSKGIHLVGVTQGFVSFSPANAPLSCSWLVTPTSPSHLVDAQLPSGHHPKPYPTSCTAQIHISGQFQELTIPFFHNLTYPICQFRINKQCFLALNWENYCSASGIISTFSNSEERITSICSIGEEEKNYWCHKPWPAAIRSISEAKL